MLKQKLVHTCTSHYTPPFKIGGTLVHCPTQDVCLNLWINSFHLFDSVSHSGSECSDCSGGSVLATHSILTLPNYLYINTISQHITLFLDIFSSHNRDDSGRLTHLAIRSQKTLDLSGLLSTSFLVLNSCKHSACEKLQLWQRWLWSSFFLDCFSITLCCMFRFSTFSCKWTLLPINISNGDKTVVVWDVIQYWNNNLATITNQILSWIFSSRIKHLYSSFHKSIDNGW